MNNPRHEILHWAEQGHLNPADLPAILAENGITPARRDWRVLFDHITLWLGTMFLALGVICFVAWNWADMGRFAKFGLLQGLILLSLLPLWRLGLERVEAKAALLLTSLLIGALLALIGQTYQTGADTFELFGVWALAILPLVLLARFSPLWMVWLVLLNLTLHFYFSIMGGFWGMVFGLDEHLWAMLALNGVAWCAGEAATRLSQIGGAQICTRAVLVFCTALLTAAVIFAIFDHRNHYRILATLVYPAWLALMFYLYRLRWPDLLALAANALSVIAIITALLSDALLKGRAQGELLLIGLVVIILSGLAGWWLKTVARELRA